VDRQQAIASVQQRIAELVGTQEPMVVLADRVIEGEWGWYIPWMARVDAEAGNPPAPGIAPFIVLRATGEVRSLLSGAFERSVLDLLGVSAGSALLAELGGRA
jgi:hypothetical protein